MSAICIQYFILFYIFVVIIVRYQFSSTSLHIFYSCLCLYVYANAVHFWMLKLIFKIKAKQWNNKSSKTLFKRFDLPVSASSRWRTFWFPPFSTFLRASLRSRVPLRIPRSNSSASSPICELFCKTHQLTSFYLHSLTTVVMLEKHKLTKKDFIHAEI